MTIQIMGAKTLSITAFSITTLSIMVFSVMTLSIKGFFVTLNTKDTQHNKVLY